MCETVPHGKNLPCGTHLRCTISTCVSGCAAAHSYKVHVFWSALRAIAPDCAASDFIPGGQSQDTSFTNEVFGMVCVVGSWGLAYWF